MIAGSYLAIDCIYRVTLRQRCVNGFSGFCCRVLCFPWTAALVFVHIASLPYSASVAFCIIHPCFASFVLVFCPFFRPFIRCRFLGCSCAVVLLIYIFNDISAVSGLQLQPFRDYVRNYPLVFVRFDTCVFLSNRVQWDVSSWNRLQINCSMFQSSIFHHNIYL